jgi:hypothetical protein
MNQNEFFQLKEMVKQNAFRKTLFAHIVNTILLTICMIAIVALILVVHIYKSKLMLVDPSWDWYNILYWVFAIPLSMVFTNWVVYIYPVNSIAKKQIKELNKAFEWSKKNGNVDYTTLESMKEFF